MSGVSRDFRMLCVYGLPFRPRLLLPGTTPSYVFTPLSALDLLPMGKIYIESRANEWREER